MNLLILLALNPGPPPDASLTYPASTGSMIASTVLLLAGVIAVLATLILGILGIVFLSQSSSAQDDIEKKRKKKIGIISCVIGPALIVLVLILYAIIQFISH